MSSDGSGSPGIGRVALPSWIEGKKDVEFDAGNPAPVKEWPMCGPPNKEAQAKADAVYFANAAVKAVKDHARGSGNVLLTGSDTINRDVHEPVVLHQGVRMATLDEITRHFDVTESLAGPDEFEDYVADVFDVAQLLMLRKHRDYGPRNIADAPGGPLNGLRVRMHDKMARINNLIDKGVEPENESLRDSFLDMLNYSAIAMLVLDNHWPGTE